MSFSVTAISALPDGGALLATDLIPVQRGSTVMKTTLTGSAFTILAGEEITAGQAVTINTSGQAVLARANLASTSNCIGFASADAAVGEPVALSQIYAEVAPSMTIGSYYYLSATTAGAITATPPSSGNYLVPVGIAVSIGSLFINLGVPSLIS